LSRVCAILVTFNRRELLRVSLDSLRRQTRPLDRILVIDNASTDGTGAMLDADYPQLARLNLKEHAGGAGGVTAGLRWAHCNKFDWMLVLDDSVELKPACLETMLSFEGDGDLIQVRKEPARAGGGGWEFTQECDFQGVLIGRKVIETAGLPDERYFNADDRAYGLIAARKARSIQLDYAGVVKLAADEGPKNRADFYLSVRNRFLDREQRVRNGLAPAGYSFFLETLGLFLNRLGQAASSSGDKAQNAMAAIDGLRDGLHRRFDRVPRL
jgi:glycosyltransferase involved in cell wall biosynthesis